MTAQNASVGQPFAEEVEFVIRPRPGILKRLSRNPIAFGAFVCVALFSAIAIFAPLIAHWRYDAINVPDAQQFPSLRHPFGTDVLGRDILSRVIWATRYSFMVAVTVQLISLVVGVPIGFLAGLKGGVFETLINQVVTVFTSLPGFLFAMFLLSALGGGIPQLVLALTTTGWVGYARIMRGEVLRLKQRDFVLAARAVGANESRIAIRHLLPNSLTALIVSVALGIPNTIYAEAGLSFLGLGIRDPLPSWGKMISDSIPYLRLFWHLAVFPLLALSLATLGFMFLADALRDLLDVSNIGG